MLPFIIWLGAIIGWTIGIFEAIIAAPLWAVMHVHPSGEDFAGKGASGYMLILQMALRPGLMIFGLAGAMLLLLPMAYIVNSIYFDVFTSSQTGNLTWLMTTLGGTAVYCFIMLAVIQKSFALVHVIPDQIMKWIGAGADGVVGQSAQDVSGKVEGGFGQRAEGAAYNAGSMAGGHDPRRAQAASHGESINASKINPTATGSSHARSAPNEPAQRSFAEEELADQQAATAEHGYQGDKWSHNAQKGGASAKADFSRAATEYTAAGKSADNAAERASYFAKAEDARRRADAIKS